MSWVTRNRLGTLVLLVAILEGCGVERSNSQPVEVTAAALLGTADCPAGYNVIQGTAGANTLNGTAGNDCILGLAGNDTINGNGGNDFLIGGTGNDTLRGGDGNDVLHGEDGTDRLEGQNNDDTLYGGIAIDNMYGGSGNDALYGGSGADELGGDDGNDRLFGEADADKLYGDGNDDILDGGAANDECYGGSGNDVITGGAGNDLLVGDAGNDFIADASGTNTIHGGDAGSDSCTGFSCELPSPTQSGCTATAQCATSQTCVTDVGMCTACGAVGGVGCNSGDLCPSDPNKTAPGICGCGVPDTDSDGDGTPNCNDACPNNAPKIAPGVCGCATADTDSDSDGTPNCNDACPSDAAKIAAGVCGCGVADTDSDSDGTANCNDACPNNAPKIAPGVCGCGVADTDSDSDGTPNCNDACPSDAAKVAAGICGCGVADTDSDSDGTANCNDACPSDATKVAAGTCGCGVADTDSDSDGTANCNDGCVSDPNKVAAGVCGCGVADTDSDSDGTPNCNDACPSDATKIAAGVCGCGVADTDSDSDGTANCNDACPSDASKISVGACGCGVADADADGDGFADCVDACPSDPAKTDPGACGCGASDEDSDLDGIQDCDDVCFGSPDHADADQDGIPDGCDGPVGECTASSTGPGVWAGDFEVHGAVSPFDRIILQGVQCIAGTVVVEGTNLVDLAMFGTVRGISGDLIIDGNAQLTSVNGLENLTDIGGGLVVTDNPALTNLDALMSLEDVATGSTVHPLTIDNNAQLPACWVGVLEELTLLDCERRLGIGGTIECSGNSGTGSCPSTTIPCSPGMTGPGIYDGDVGIDAAEDLDALAGVECITGSLVIFVSPVMNVDALTSLRAIGGSLIIVDNMWLRNVDGLDSLTSVGVHVYIGENNMLGDLAGLARLRHVGEAAPLGEAPLMIGHNAGLPSCWVGVIEDQVGLECGYASYACIGNYGTASCGSLPPGFDCVPGARGPGVYDGDVSLGFDEYYSPSINDLGGVTCITGNVDVQPYSQLSDAEAALSHLVAIGGTLMVAGTPQRNLAMFQHLASVGRSVTISNNLGMASLSGLASLIEIGAHAQPGDVPLTVSGNPCLPQAEIDALAERVDLTCGDGLAAQSSCEGNADQAACEAIGCYDGPYPLDGDGDGISDLCDACQYEADDDLDNICDAVDPCPYDPDNDADHDGVCAPSDICLEGDDALDADADGIPDACDSCPTDAGNDPDNDGVCAAVDTCPYGYDGDDADADGVCDTMDSCPNEDDGVDQDGDGIADCLVFVGTTAPVGPTNVARLVTADLNGDGHSDLIVGTATGALQQWLRGADGSFSLKQSQSISDGYSGPLKAIDANADGRIDVIVGAPPSSNARVRILTGDGTGDMTLWRSGPGTTSSYGFGDITGDGYPDLVLASYTKVHAFLGAANPANAYTQEITVATRNTPPEQNFIDGAYLYRNFEVGNIDEDPELEILVPGGTMYYADRSGSGYVIVRVEASYYGDFQFGFGLQIADFDGDGANDLVLNQSDKLRLYLRRPTTGVDPRLTLVAGTTTYVRVDEIRPLLSDYFGGYYAVIHPDLVGSTRPDLVFATQNRVTIATAEQQAGAWRWQVVQQLPLGTQYDFGGGAVASGDFNGDALPDLAYVRYGAVYIRYQR